MNAIEQLVTEFSRDMVDLLTQQALADIETSLGSTRAPAVAPVSKPKRPAARVKPTAAPASPQPAEMPLRDAVREVVKHGPLPIKKIVEEVLKLRPSSTANSISTNVAIMARKGLLVRHGSAGSFEYGAAWGGVPALPAP